MKATGLFKTNTAVFSECRRYRYLLTRQWGPSTLHVLFIMLNPSTADDVLDDPTIRRCIGFARAWGYDGLSVCNLFAYRATSPQTMKDAPDPVGPQNDLHIIRASERANVIVAAWGTLGNFKGRAKVVYTQNPKPLWCLGTTQGGQPRHPLFVRGDTRLELYWR